MSINNKKIGRPWGSIELRKLRSQVWYLNVKSKEGLSDYQLDKKFAYGPTPIPRASGERVKAFEAIRGNFSIPMKGTTNKRGFDLVSFVDLDPLYTGTAQILNSPFWRLMEQKPITLKDIRNIVIECVNLLGLAKQSGNYEYVYCDPLKEFVDKNPEAPLEDYFTMHNVLEDAYDAAMGEVFRSLIPSLDYIALICALSFEAIEAGNMKIAVYQIEVCSTQLKMYCQSPWLNSIGEDLYHYVMTRMASAVNANALKDLPDYVSMLARTPDVNFKSSAVAFLKHHQGVLWRLKI